MHFNNQAEYGETPTHIYDFSGSGNNGSCTACPTQTPGKFSGAFDYDGTNDYITAGDVSNRVQTVSFWIKPDDTTTKIIDLNSASNIEIINGTVIANNFNNPIIYVDGIEESGIEFDFASSATTAVGQQTSLGWSHTVSGSNRILIVGVGIRKSSGSASSVSSITYNGVSLTKINHVQDSAGAGSRTELWYLLNPDTGTHYVNVTMGAAKPFAAGAISFKGVHQASPLGSEAASTGSGTTASVSVSSSIGELVVDAVTSADDTLPIPTLTAGSGQTGHWSEELNSGSGHLGRTGGSQEAGAASVTMSWSISESRPWTIIAVPLKPPAGINNDWHHVVITSNAPINANSVDIGRTGSGYFNGIIDELAIWNRPLSPQEIQDLYSSGAPIPCGTFHRADTNHDNCIKTNELLAFIFRWKISSQDVPMPELMEAIGLWKAGTIIN
jgi:hypothetical protein